MNTLSSDSLNPEYVAAIDFSRTTSRYLSIQATGGDNYYSVSELQAFGTAKVPEPLLLSLGVLIGFAQLRRKNKLAF